MLTRLIGELRGLVTWTVACERCGARDLTVERWVVSVPGPAEQESCEALCHECVERARANGHHVKRPRTLVFPYA